VLETNAIRARRNIYGTWVPKSLNPNNATEMFAPKPSKFWAAYYSWRLKS
jgi:hypothetical protein